MAKHLSNTYVFFTDNAQDNGSNRASLSREARKQQPRPCRHKKTYLDWHLQIKIFISEMRYWTIKRWNIMSRNLSIHSRIKRKLPFQCCIDLSVREKRVVRKVSQPPSHYSTWFPCDKASILPFEDVCWLFDYTVCLNGVDQFPPLWVSQTRVQSLLSI